MSRLCLSIPVFSLLLTAAFAFQADTTIKARTEVVLVPTVVRDSSGKPVTGLKKEDFVVLEDGKPKEVAFFEETKTAVNVRPEKTEAGEYSNAYAQDSAQKRVTIVVLDMLNTAFQDQAYAREQLLKYLSTSLDGREPTSLFLLGRKGLVRVHDFTSDPRGLIAALKAVSGQAPGNVTPTSGADVGFSTELISGILASQTNDPNSSVSDPMIRAATDTAERLAVFRRGGDGEYASLQDRITVGQTLAAFQQIAHAYTGVPGRKSMIWATGGFPFDVTSSGGLQLPSHFSSGTAATNSLLGGRSYDSSGALPSLPESTSILQGGDLAQLIPVYERTLQLLTTANIAVYPVDARGLVAFSADAARSTSNPGLQSDLRGQQFTSQTSMEGMASATGGKAFYNRNDLNTGFKQASDDGETYYTLAYYRDQKTSPGWHKLEVKLNKPGLQVRSRRGYIIPKTAPDAKASRLLDIATAMSSPFDFSGIPFFVRWTGQSEDKKGKKRIKFDMWVPGDKNVAAPDKMKWEVWAAVQDSKGAIVDQMGEVIGEKLSPELIAQVYSQGMAYNNQLVAPPGDYKVKFILRDNLSGRLGSLQVPLKVQ